MLNKKIYKKLFFTLLEILNTKKQYLKNIKQNNNLIVLNLHRVSEDSNPFYPSLHPTLFEELLKFISQHFNVITFGEIEAYKNSDKPNLILSFDDGFYDFLEYAMPLMKKYHIQANLNIIPLCLETQQPIWDVMLGDVLNQVPMIVINHLKFLGFSMKLTLENQSSYALALIAYLKSKPQKERQKIWKIFEDLIQEYNVVITKILSKKDIIEIFKIHEIGVHSYSHESMGIESQVYFENDFLKCQKYFQNILLLPLDIYAFPNGSYEAYQLDFLRQNHIKHILLVNEEYANYDSHTYNRFTFYGDSISEIKMRALGWTR